MRDPALLDLTEAAAEVAAGRLRADDLLAACRERIAAWQPATNAFLAVDFPATGAAGAGPLAGVPLAHKDMFYRAGRISTCGSRVFAETVQTTTATVLERLDDAGALEIGRLHMAELAAGPTGHNVHYGACRNPWNRAYITGGSSSGSGAAVAARTVYGALGSDTGGSVRLPAAANGVVGLKPTYGRVSRYGCLPRSWSQDCVGPLARTARDCLLLLQAIAGADPHDPTTVDRPLGPLPAIAGRTLGVVEPDGVDPEVEAALAASRRVLEAQGLRTRPVRLPDLSLLYQVAETITKAEAAAMHRPWLEARPQDCAAQVRSRLEAGFYIPATQYIDALRLRPKLTEDFLAACLDQADLLHLPMIPFPLPRLDESDVESGGGPAVLALVARITRFTRPINLLGLPAVSVPCGFDGSGLPLAFQLVGRHFEEPLLLAVADAYQQATDFHRTVPSL